MSESKQTVGAFLGDTAAKTIAAIVLFLCTSGVAGFGVWMLTIHTSLATLGVKLDVINATIAETKDASAKANALAEDNSRRIQRIEDTRYTRDDALECERKLESISTRLARLESGRRR